MSEIYQTIYKDDYIIVVSKPAGLLSIPDRYDAKIPNMKHILRVEYDEIYVAHRLDRDTSGVMVFAFTPEAHQILNQQFQEQQAERIYHVVVAGIVSRDEIDIDIPLTADPRKKGKTIPSANGKESLTKLKVIERYRQATLVECSLVSGRHHQIRAHCAAIGHPLLIDELYGNATEFKLSSIKRKFNLKKNETEMPLITRITMHSYKLGFKHPQTNEKVCYIADYPKDFRALVQVLGKYSKLPNYYSPPVEM